MPISDTLLLLLFLTSPIYFIVCARLFTNRISSLFWDIEFSKFKQISAIIEPHLYENVTDFRNMNITIGDLKVGTWVEDSNSVLNRFIVNQTIQGSFYNSSLFLILMYVLIAQINFFEAGIKIGFIFFVNFFILLFATLYFEAAKPKLRSVLVFKIDRWSARVSHLWGILLASAAYFQREKIEQANILIESWLQTLDSKWWLFKYNNQYIFEMLGGLFFALIVVGFLSLLIGPTIIDFVKKVRRNKIL